VFANCGLTKLQVLNPFDGKYDESWSVDIPTYECVPNNERSNESKMVDALNDLYLEVLSKSGSVVTCERRDSINAELLVTVFQKGKKDKIQASLNTQQRNYNFSKINDENRVLLYADYNSGEIAFSIYDIYNPEAGFVSYSIGKGLNATVINGFGWDNN